MKYDSINREINKIAGIESAYEDMIKEYSLKQNKKIIASPCYFIPPEINAAFNIITLKIPEFILNNDEAAPSLFSLYDSIIISDKDCFCNKNINSDASTYIFKTPESFGEDASVLLHNEIQLMLKTIFSIDIKSINIETLQRQTIIYENLRRLVRSISSLRSRNINLLSNSELSLIFETALIIPPEIAIEYLTPVFDEMKKISDSSEIFLTRGLFYGGKVIPSAIADSIEESGILILEDDCCTGRRLFDISLNADSEYIFYELLDAYSYRPLTPCLRPVNERYELLYKLLKNYNIETVIFFKDENCSQSMADIDFLRIRMMRDGIDPLVIDKDNYLEVISNYVKII